MELWQHGSRHAYDCLLAKYVFLSNAAKTKVCSYAVHGERCLKWNSQKISGKKIEHKKEFLRLIRSKIMPVLSTILFGLGYSNGFRSTTQHYLSCQYCNPAEIILLEMMHKDHLWLM